VAPRVDQEINLTVGGLAQCRPETDRVIDVFLSTLNILDAQRRKAVPTPHAVATSSISVPDLIGALEGRGVDVGGPSGWKQSIGQLRQLLGHEPVWGTMSVTGGVDSLDWTCTPQSDLRLFAPVADVGDYLRYVAEFTLPPVFVPPPTHPSTLLLPEAVDFLDVVWKGQFDGHLFALPGAKRTSELGLACATPDEFESRISAFADLVARMKLPGDGEGGLKREGSLKRLEDFLLPKLPEGGSRERTAEAIRRLRYVNDVRRGGQHHGVAEARADAFRAPGIAFPPSDWGAAWADIQVMAVDAFSAIREEIQATWS
jgi:hypothetical protein